MFSQNSISKDLQDSILKVMEGNIKHPNQQKIDVHEPMKEATKIIVHDDEAEDKKLIKKMIDKEKKVDEATALQKMGNPRFAQNLPTMGHAGSVTMKHVNASSATPQVKAAIKKAAPDIKTYGDRAAALNAAGIKREEVEGSMPKTPKEKELAAKHGHPGRITYGDVLKARGVKMKEEVEQFDETVLVHATYEIKESYTFGEYLTTAKYLVGDDEAVELANEAFKVQDTDIFAEELSSMDIMSRINSHRKAGHAVTEPKYSTKAGKPYHEYVVTDKETGTRRKYIHHGDVSKVENMGAKPKKDEQ